MLLQQLAASLLVRVLRVLRSTLMAKSLTLGHFLCMIRISPKSVSNHFFNKKSRSKLQILSVKYQKHVVLQNHFQCNIALHKNCMFLKKFALIHHKMSSLGVETHGCQKCVSLCVFMKYNMLFLIQTSCQQAES